jgi:hypothetical protein
MFLTKNIRIVIRLASVRVPDYFKMHTYDNLA